MQQAFFATKNGTLYMGDCFDVLPEIPDGSIDMILCDLPYGTTNFKWDKKLPFGRLWAEYSRLIREHGAIALTAQQPFATDLITTGRKLFRYELIWEKTLACGFLNANRMPLRAHENILIFYKKLPVYHPQMTPGTSYYKKGGGAAASTGRSTASRNIEIPGSAIRAASCVFPAPTASTGTPRRNPWNSSSG